MSETNINATNNATKNDESKKKLGIMDIALMVVTILFALGIKFVFNPCGPKEDGTWMHCHSAGQLVFWLALLMVVISVVHAAVKKPNIKLYLSLCFIPLAIITLLTPGHIISLCMMETMRCHSVMKPAVIVFSVIILALATINLFIQRASKKYEDKWGTYN